MPRNIDKCLPWAVYSDRSDYIQQHFNKVLGRQHIPLYHHFTLQAKLRF